MLFINNLFSKSAVYLVFLALFASCKEASSKKEFPSSKLYDLNNPKEIRLPAELDEISGIAYYQKDTSVFAISDEADKLWKISLNDPKNIRSWKLDKKRDYEEIVLLDSTFYILISTGDILKVNFNGGETVCEKTDFKTQVKQSNEFETLYFGPDSNKLVMLCKDCDFDSKNTINSFNVITGDSVLQYEQGVVFDMSTLNKNLGQEKHLKPSAAAVHPMTGEVYILSTIQSLIVVASPDGKVSEYFKLDPGIYKQAEGIAFTPTGDMIISNEIGESGSANLLLYKNKLTDKQ